ncbi:hypothetical protein JCM9140_3037 [Halalkalibacter wakoensis JCM 9140]|uniref:HipA-like kinase domain-containing protein n=1 Tax=Halalkalibacter wakoensis JCM 9140 TaxID=1236970 RepID=W4Q6F0_9BACI|nr:HipA family kinase [Halalkalibacter wakoensis]GAE26929.1 hypothetical protein JCM9140_3037 [Halalkalibacter wakoensis JCM 9140]
MLIPVEYKSCLNKHTKNVHIITCDDQKDYVITFFLPSHEKALVNEWLGYCLARYLQLPVPSSSIVEVPNDFYEAIPELRDLPYMKHHFASLHIKDCLSDYSTNLVDKITNSEQLAGIIVLDFWLSNPGRTQKKLLVKEWRNSEYKLWIIDHAKSFGSASWKRSDLKTLPKDMNESYTHQLIASSTTKEWNLKEYLERIQSIPALLLDEILSFVPEEWSLSKEEKKRNHQKTKTPQPLCTSRINRRLY